MSAAEVKLIEYEEGHRIAWEAAAAFKPSYWGPDFRAHSWVVEAVRSAHMDGQRFAQGLPRIERSAASGNQAQGFADRRLTQKAIPSVEEMANALRDLTDATGQWIGHSDQLAAAYYEAKILLNRMEPL